MKLPSLSIIIPSYNQAFFLEETLLSIFNQHYPHLEVIIIDGGSIDGSVEIIKKYIDKVAYWVSEPDLGQSHAINKGLKKAAGEWVAWMNSDDCYMPGAFEYVFTNLAWHQNDFIFGNSCYGTSLAKAKLFVHKPEGKMNLKGILKFCYSIEHIIPSQSVFIRRSILSKAGLLDVNIHYCMDFEWYCRIFLVTDRILYYPVTISFFRSHPHSKTGSSNHNGREESIEIAEKYLQYLPIHEQREVKTAIAYMQELWTPKPAGLKGILKYLHMATRFGKVATKHPSFKVALIRHVKHWCHI